MKKKRLIKKLVNLTLIGGGILTTLPLVITSCSRYNKPVIAHQITADYVGNLHDGVTITVVLKENAK
jgi:hypothetical protein